jgi:hypothetical protein
MVAVLDGLPTIEITSWAAFVQHVSTLINSSPHPFSYLCRGQSDKSWGLKPSLQRLFPKGIDAKTAVEREDFGLQEFRAQAHLYLAQGHLPVAATISLEWGANLLEWWALMQHHP